MLISQVQATDLKPHKSESWLNSHDPDSDATARDIYQPCVSAPQFYQQGRLVICCNEKTVMQILEWKHPNQAAGSRHAVPPHPTPTAIGPNLSWSLTATF